MERKEKIEELIRIREKAIILEEKLINDLLVKCYDKIRQNSKSLVEEIYNDLIKESNNPYLPELIEEIKFNMDVESEFIKIPESIITFKGTDVDDIIMKRFRINKIWGNLNKDELCYVTYEKHNYVIYINELCDLLNEYGLDYKSFKSDNYRTLTIKVNLDEHTLKIKQN